MDLRAYLSTLRRSWWLIALPVVAGLAAAIVLLGAQTPKYLSTANVYVSVGNASNANDLSQANSFAQSAAANFAALAEQPYVLHAVRQQLGLTLTSDQIAKEMTTSVEQNTSIIGIDVLDPSPTRAAQIANTTAAQLSTAVSVLNPSAADGTQNVKVTVVRTAGVADVATVPNRPLGIALGLLGGLLLGVVLVILRELLDTRVRTTADLQHLSGAPVVGQIPRSSRVADHPLVLVDDPASAAAEGFRLLQLNTEYLRAPDGVVTVGIASAVPSEGKSTVAANLALALAAAGHRVALVDADLRRPRLHSMFGLDGGLGLTEVLIGRADVLDVVQPWGADDARIAVVPAGSVPPNPGELLQSPRLRAALDRLAEEADVVIVDGPPLLAVADSAVLARTVDAVLLVASLRRSHRAPVVRAVGGLQNVGARVLGTVATMTRPSRADSDAYLRYTRHAVASRPAEPAEQEPEASEPARERSRRAPKAKRAEAALPTPEALEPAVDEQPPVEGKARKPRRARRGRTEDAPRAEEPAAEETPARAERSLLEEWFAADEPAAAAEPARPAADEQRHGAEPLRSFLRPLSVRDAEALTLRALHAAVPDEDLGLFRGFPQRGAYGS